MRARRTRRAPPTAHRPPPTARSRSTSGLESERCARAIARRILSSVAGNGARIIWVCLWRKVCSTRTRPRSLASARARAPVSVENCCNEGRNAATSTRRRICARAYELERSRTAPRARCFLFARLVLKQIDERERRRARSRRPRLPPHANVQIVAAIAIRFCTSLLDENCFILATVF